jgi:hypothetical protein
VDVDVGATVWLVVAAPPVVVVLGAAVERLVAEAVLEDSPPEPEPVGEPSKPNSC